MLCPECGMPMTPVYRSLDEWGVGPLSCDPLGQEDYLYLWYCPPCNIVEEAGAECGMTKDAVKRRHEMLHE